MRPSLTLPEIHERFKKHSLSQKLESTPLEKKDEQYRMFEVKLQTHRQQLEKNNEVIRQLTMNFDILRHELVSQQKNSEQLQQTIKRFREEIERLNKQLRISKAKCEELERQLLKEQDQRNSIVNIVEESEMQSSEMQKKLQKLEAQFNEHRKLLSKTTAELNESRERCEKYRKQTKQLEEVMLKQKTGYEEGVHKLQEMVNKYEKTINDLKCELSNESGKQLKIISELETKISKLSKTLEIKEHQFQIKCQQLKKVENWKKQGELQIEKLKKQLSQEKERASKNDITTRDMISTIQDYQAKCAELESKLNTFSNQLTKTQHQLHVSKEETKKYASAQLKLLDLTKLSGKLLQGQKNIQKSVQCTFCQQQMKQPVTIIPCGHCFCLGCKKGYQKQCSKCGPQVKIEALYRNQLMDDMINILKILTNIGSLIASNQEKIEKH